MLGLLFLLIFIGIPLVVLLMKLEDRRAARDEKLGIHNGPNRRAFRLPESGPQAYRSGDRVRAINPAAAGFTTGKVEDLFWPGTPRWYPKVDSTPSVRDDATGKLFWVNRYDVEKVA